VYQPKTLERPGHAAKITWCACERCLALGPQPVTLKQGGRARTVSFRHTCCGTSNTNAEGSDYD
jgi:hypothetical protein